VVNFTAVEPNGIYLVNEGGSLDPRGLEPIRSFECDAPPIDIDVDTAVLVWNNCFNGRWTVRMTSANSPITYNGILVSSAAGIVDYEPQGNEATDILPPASGGRRFRDSRRNG
jgi:hypothetical protein